MKKHGFRSIFSLLLALMMVCSMLPTAAFAEGDVEEQPVVVETYTVTYADGMGGAAFPEQKKEGLLYGDPTPAFAGEPALDGYTFTGWDQEIAATVTQSVTYTALWQEVQQEAQSDVQPDVQPDVQLEADGNGATVREQVVLGRSELTVPQIPKPDIDLTALDTGHKIDVRFTVLYVGSEFNIGYNYGSSEKTKFVCQYTTNHSDTAATNHTIAISDIKAAAGRATVNSGYQIVGWSKESNANPKTLSLNMSGTTACNKGNTIYLVAKNPNPTTKYTYVLKYDANGGTGAPGDDSWDTTDASIKYHYFTVTSAVPTRAGYTFKGWKGKANDGSDEIYTGGKACAVSQYGNDVVKNDNTWTRTLYAVWEENRPSATWNEISKVLGTQVYVQCVSDTENHAKQGYELRYESSAVGRVPGGYACNVYVYANGKPGLTSYVEEYNTTYPNTNHVLDSDSDTGRRGFELRYNDGGDGWYIYKGDSVPIVFKVKCEAEEPSKPYKPGDDEVKNLLGDNAVQITCTNTQIGHGSKTFGLIDGTFTVHQSNNRCEVVINGFSSYMSAFDAAVSVPTGTHITDNSMAGQNKTKINLVWSDGRWTPADAPAKYHVLCTLQPAPSSPPTFDELVNILGAEAVKVVCTNAAAGHAGAAYALKEDTISNFSHSGGSNGHTYKFDINSAKYVAAYNETTGKTHTPDDAVTSVTLVWQNGGWEVQSGTPVVFNVACDAQPMPDKPTAPDDGTVKRTLTNAVKITCITNSGHAPQTYDLASGFTPGTVEGNASTGYTYTIFVSADKYVDWYSETLGVDHTLDPDDISPKSITLKWDGTAWVAPDDGLPINFNVKCKTGNPPVDIRKPTFDELKALLSVKVECTNESATHGTKSELYALKNNDEDSKFEIGEVNQSGDVPTCTVTIGSRPYVAAFDGTTGKAHNPADTTKTVDLVYNKETGKWALENENDAPVVFQVACTTEEPSKPYKPNAEDLLSVVIHCKSDVHNDGLYDLKDGNFTVGEVEGNEADGYTCKVTVEAAQYVNKYVGEMKVNHDIVGEGTKTVTLRYESALERWIVDSTVVTFDVECIPAPNISMLQVQVHCVTPNSSHMDEFYDLPEDTTLEYVDANTRRITVQAAPYVEQYGNGHELADGESESKTITATWDGVKWNFDATSVTFNVKCTTQEGPAAPTAEQVASLLKVKVSCANSSAAHQENMPAFVYQPLLPRSFGIGGVTGSAESGYACQITVRAALYVQDFNTRSNATHTPTDGEEKPVTLYYEDGGWTVGTGSGLVEFTVICENVPAQKYTVTYTDGVDGVEIFKDQVYADLTAGTATPKFNGTPTRVGYFFAGWNPAVTATVTGNTTYTATWKVDSNNNGKPDDEETRYTVTYLDGANGKAFASQVYPGLLSGTATPKFNGTPVRSGYVFIGWSPVWSGTVTGNVTYTATWSTITGGLDKVPKTGDNGLTLALSALLLFSFCGAAACVVSTKKRG